MSEHRNSNHVPASHVDRDDYSPAAHLCGPATEESVYDERGVDRSLIRWMLSLSPLERLLNAEAAAATLLAAKHDRR